MNNPSYPAVVENFTAVEFELYGIFDQGDHCSSSFFVTVYGVLPEPSSGLLFLIGLCGMRLRRNR